MHPRDVFCGEAKESTAPGAASSGPGRRESVSVAGRSAVPRRGRFGPALLRSSPAMQLPLPSLAATRGASFPTVAAGLLFGGDGVAARHFPPDVRGCLPGHRHHLARHDSVGFDQGRGNRPVVPRENRNVSRSAVLPCVGCPCGPALWPPGASPESPLPPRNTAAWRVRADGVHLPMRSAILDASASQWHLGVGLRELRLPRRAGFPPAVRAYPVWSEWLPTDHLAAVPRRRGIYTRHQGGTRKKLLAALPPLAAMPI